MTEQTDGYVDLATRMVDLASRQAGFLGIETAQNTDGSSVTVPIGKMKVQSVPGRKTSITRRRSASDGKRSIEFHGARARVDRDYTFDKNA